MRVNARLDDAAAEQIEYLTSTTGMGVSHVVREGVALYYRQVKAQRAGLTHLGALIGKGDSGRSDIAGDVKSFVGAGFAAKHGKK